MFLVRMLKIVCCVFVVILVAAEMVYSVDCDEARFFFDLSEQMEESTAVLEFKTTCLYLSHATSSSTLRSAVACG